MLGFNRLMHCIIRRWKLYLHRTIQLLIWSLVVALAYLAALQSAESLQIALYLASASLVGFNLYLEFRWLRHHRLPLIGQWGLPQFRTAKKDSNGKAKESLTGAHWRSLWDLWYRCHWSWAGQWKSKPGRIFLGKLAPEQRPFGILGPAHIGFAPGRHALTIAPTRAGKGVMGIVPNLLMLQDPAMIIDPMGELAETTAPRRGHGKRQFKQSRVRKGLGQQVSIFDPYDTTKGMGNATYNPLDEIDVHSDSAVTMAGAIAQSIVSESEPDGQDRSFSERAREFIEAVILHVKTTEEPVNQSLPQVWSLITRGDKEYLNLLQAEAHRQCVTLDVHTPMEALFSCMASNLAFDGIISAMGSEMLELVPETRDGILFFARTQLEFLKDPKIRKALRTSTFQLQDLFYKKATIYLCMPIMRIAGKERRVLAMFLNLLIECSGAVVDPTEHPFLIVDEFPALGYFRALERAMGLLKYRLTLWLIAQDTSQLKSIYGKAWETFVSNSALIAFQMANPETANWLSQLLGTVTGPDGPRPLVTPEELLGQFNEPEDRRVIFKDGVPAILEGCPYYEMFPKDLYDDV